MDRPDPPLRAGSDQDGQTFTSGSGTADLVNASDHTRVGLPRRIGRSRSPLGDQPVAEQGTLHRDEGAQIHSGLRGTSRDHHSASLHHTASARSVDSSDHVLLATIGPWQEKDVMDLAR